MPDNNLTFTNVPRKENIFSSQDIHFEIIIILDPIDSKYVVWCAVYAYYICIDGIYIVIHYIVIEIVNICPCRVKKKDQKLWPLSKRALTFWKCPVDL